jgi:ParB family chromosome partitioning protein
MRYSAGTGEYLNFLAADGYQLAEVEGIIVGERTADEVYQETLTTGGDTADDDGSDGSQDVPTDETDGEQE